MFCLFYVLLFFFFFKRKTAYEMRISDWSSDVCSSDLGEGRGLLAVEVALEAVADRLVQHDARPAGAEDDGHLAGRGRDRIELHQRLAQRLVEIGRASCRERVCQYV